MCNSIGAKPLVQSLIMINIAFTFVVTASSVSAQPSFAEALEVLQKDREYEKYNFSYTMIKTQLSENADEESLTILEEGAMSGIPSKGLWLTRRIDKILSRNNPPPVSKNGNPSDNNGIAPTDDYLTILNQQLRYDFCRDGTVFTVLPSTGRIYSEAPASLIPFPIKPFDFRLLGIGFYGDIISGSSLEKVIETHSPTKGLMPAGKWITDDQASVVRFDSKSRIYDFDLEKGSWVTHHQLLTFRKILGKRVPVVHSQTDLKVEQVNGLWVPTYAKIRGINTYIEIFFTWLPNEEVKETNFNIDYVRELIKLDIRKLESNADGLE